MWTLGQRLKELRKEANLTQQELSEGIVTRAYISQIEKGLVQPSYETLKLLAERLNCSVENLFVEPENKVLQLSETKRKIKMAESFVESGKFEQASKVILSVSQSLSERWLTGPEKGVYLWIKGKLLEKERSWETAAKYYSQSKELLSDGSHSRALVRTIDSLGYTYLQLDKNYDALSTLNEALGLLAKETIGGILQISVYLNIGIAHGKIGEFYSAIRLLQEAKDLNEATGYLYKQGQILMSLGVCYRNVNQLHDAEASYRKALSFFEMTADLENAAGTKTNLGVLYGVLQQYEQSIQFLSSAIAAYERLQLQTRQQNAKLELAKTLVQCQRYEEAKQLCRELIAQSPVREKHAILAHRCIADIACFEQNYEKALESYLLSLRYLKEHGFVAELKETYGKVADIYFAKEDYQTAAHYYRLGKEC
ncbi:helix-turn-helix domain-containing protein [Brevibacillus sp. H7]|uniref:helix-turn-helix domain-containing protein n=1 Tax=Brevibacillus sp. H7 TaxID=3349138 RepID=UPI0037F598AA